MTFSVEKKHDNESGRRVTGDLGIHMRIVFAVSKCVPSVCICTLANGFFGN